MLPQRRTALVSVGAACLLIAIKLIAGIASSSLGLLAEAAHSGTDLAAALLTFFAVSVAVRPADRGHPYGHHKAQNLAALAEAGFLVAVSVLIAALAILRLVGVVEFEVDPTWWAFAAIVLVVLIDASRTFVSLRGARLYRSDALLSNALHFGSDLVGTLAVLVGLAAAALGFPAGDSIAALFVSVLVVVAAFRLASRNVGLPAWYIAMLSSTSLFQPSKPWISLPASPLCWNPLPSLRDWWSSMMISARSQMAL